MFARPLWLVYFIIIFDIYWVLKVFNFSVYLILAWRHLRRAKKTDWRAKLKGLNNVADKRHLIFVTVYNEEWSVVRPAIESIAASVYDKSKFVLVIAGEEKEEENFRRISDQTRLNFQNYFSDIVWIMHPANLLDEIPGKGSNMHYAEKRMLAYVD